jgi:60 kDa SS-A/Ro ribonucleoprotein
MSRFATKTKGVTRTPDTVNLDGGLAYRQDAKLELASLLATSFVTDGYYRGADETLNRLRELIGQVDPVFAAKAAVYMRNTDGMRSITHVTAAELASRVKGEEWTKRFFDKVVRRPDDATEILAYYLNQFGKPLPNSLKKGLGLSLGKFDAYQLARYRGEGKDISLVDVVNLCHPRPTAKNRDALAQLVKGTLRNTDTWEAKLTQAGKSENVEQAKADAWREQLVNRRIGYLALLRNLRNIAEQAPDLVPVAIELLTDEAFVQRAMVFPFQFVSAYRELQGSPRLLKAVSNAIDLSVANVPDLGNTLVAVDGSGSMDWHGAAGSQITNKEVGALFAAIYFKKNHSDVLVFGDTAGPVRGLNPGDSTMTLMERISKACYGHGTNFRAIFDNAPGNKYDSIVIFSDMQANLGYGHTGLAEYASKRGHTPHIFAFDLAGYGSSQFDPRKKTYQIAGFSDKTFGLLEKLKTDPQAFVRAIEAVEL